LQRSAESAFEFVLGLFLSFPSPSWCFAVFIFGKKRVLQLAYRGGIEHLSKSMLLAIRSKMPGVLNTGHGSSHRTRPHTFAEPTRWCRVRALILLVLLFL